jgi:hypothetical protein
MRTQGVRSPLRPPVWFGLATVTGQQEGTWSHLHEFAIVFAQMGGSQMDTHGGIAARASSSKPLA